MKGCMLNYYFMMDTLKEIPDVITDQFPKDASIYFNLANFSSVSSYSFIYNPFKKDKYRLDELIRNNYLDFIVECAILFKSQMEESDSYFMECLVFLYGLITTNTLRDELYPYIKGIKKDNFNLDLALNILDSHITKKKSKLNLTDKSIEAMFPTAYTYYDSLEELIRNPMIKCFHFMGTNSYYKKSYKRFHKFAKNSNKKGKLLSYKALDRIFYRHREKKIYLIYTKDEDASLLNLKKEPFIVNGIERKDSFDHIYKEAKQKAISRINALNSYLFMSKGEAEFRSQFHIDNKKKL